MPVKRPYPKTNGKVFFFSPSSHSNHLYDQFTDRREYKRLSYIYFQKGVDDRYDCVKDAQNSFQGGTMFKKIKAWIRRKQTEIKVVTTNKRGEFYLDKVIGMIIAVVIGGLLLAGLYALFNNTVLPGLTDKIQSMFS